MLVLALAAACGPGLAQQDPQAIARHDLLDASGNARALQKMMRGDVVDGGLWFADPQCTAAFPVAADLHPDRFAAFARCLAELHLQPSPRRDTFPDLAVLTYPPGIEIEALVLDEPDGPHLTWIGYAGRRDLADALPTISSAALESLRTGGNPAGGLSADAIAELQRAPTAEHRSAAWLKLCLDETGRVTSVRPRAATSFTAARVFAAAAGTWRFRPFVAAGHPIPACAMVELDYPPRKAPMHEVLPIPSPSGNELMISSDELQSDRMPGNIRIQPDNPTKLAISAAGASRVIGAFELCIDAHGHITSVLPLRSTGFRAYDAKLAAAIETWTYRPYVEEGRALPVCTVVTYVYRQR